MQARLKDGVPVAKILIDEWDKKPKSFSFVFLRFNASPLCWCVCNSGVCCSGRGDAQISWRGPIWHFRSRKFSAKSPFPSPIFTAFQAVLLSIRKEAQQLFVQTSVMPQTLLPFFLLPSFFFESRHCRKWPFNGYIWTLPVGGNGDR